MLSVPLGAAAVLLAFATVAGHAGHSSRVGHTSVHAVCAGHAGRAASQLQAAALDQAQCNVAEALRKQDSNHCVRERNTISNDLQRTSLRSQKDCDDAAWLLVVACESSHGAYVQGLNYVAKLAMESAFSQDQFGVVYKKILDFLIPSGAPDVKQPALWPTFTKLVENIVSHRQLKTVLAYEIAGHAFVEQWARLFEHWLPLVLRQEAFRIVEKYGDAGILALTLAIIKTHKSRFKEVLDFIDGDPDERKFSFKSEVRAKFRGLFEDARPSWWPFSRTRNKKFLDEVALATRQIQNLNNEGNRMMKNTLDGKR
uniref:Rab-GAP TBC domain-containing protein n=1 Tax=Zooxanthella nutricula TaxID=1333877 RepID=A0A7S2IZ79_9DINO|mmetsp:Transcript_24117/g.72451  ORF Transcript_24117/g.72451 Transcript_24117/m.72451 type:complete len:313 (+) Transcript_24117:72-1010(+)